MDDNIRKELLNARDEYIDLLRAQLLGPGSEFALPDAEHELISASPLSRYTMGILYPKEQISAEDTEEFQEIENGEDDDTEDLGENNKPIHDESAGSEESEALADNLDDEVDLSTQYKPSSMGITFFAKGSGTVVKGQVSFATYRRATFSDCIIPYAPTTDAGDYNLPDALKHKMQYDKDKGIISLISELTPKEAREIFDRKELRAKISDQEYHDLKNRAYRLARFCSTAGYVRCPYYLEFELDFSQGDYCVEPFELPENSKEKIKITALRTKISKDIWSFTVMLSNDRDAKSTAETCIFQPKITIMSADNDFVFAQNDAASNIVMPDEEEKRLALLYRDKRVYGTGLGVSVDWNIDKAGNGMICSEFFPVAEVPPIDFNLPKEQTLVTNEMLSMKVLSDLDGTPKEQKLLGLRGLVDLYKNWVAGLENAVAGLEKQHQDIAAKNIEECKKAYLRMYKGIDELTDNSNAYTAFCLANRAMFMQRVHLRLQNKDRYPGDEELSAQLLGMDYEAENDKDCIWRPFQIAFLLMDIVSIVCDDSPERDIVDLIWFPTGGGKTEAYLGLTAFTVFYRRLTHPKKAGGTAVIMRYTLRLLAAQQFTRAATLICACEIIRQETPSLGKEPITIGLWIGSSHTPNSNIGAGFGADYHLKKLENARSKYDIEKHNKFQVLKCPWCGTKMTQDIEGNKKVGRLGYEMKNGSKFYLFCTQDDCVFRLKLPIQIVDEELYKNPPTLLFGTVDKFAMLPWNGKIGAFFGVGSKNRTPELIIQDELHLISGALGTMVGLYEAAVDIICSQKGTRPKIIASTATIRRAKEQCAALYNRDVFQFPPPGLDAQDSFFAREGKISYAKGVFGRKYVGLMPSGKTKTLIETRAVATLLQKVFEMPLSEDAKDKLWTLTVYFNSLKDLGKAESQVSSTVKVFIKSLAHRGFKLRRFVGRADVLNSRTDTTRLNETLDKLEKAAYSKESTSGGRRASDVLLATNMISVGIDIARLNVMLMAGQPKLTSEYIQASSRIGRRFPGVAFVQYDAARSRDRSHYEMFKAYHDSFYSFVEPTGVTPFSKPARGRALHAVLVSIARHMWGLQEDGDAGKFDIEAYGKEIEEAKLYLTKRVKSINNLINISTNDDTEEILAEIDDFFGRWQIKAQNAVGEGKPLFFGNRFIVKPPQNQELRLLKQFNKGRDGAIDTLTSMRNVDTPVRGKVLIWEDE
jgi:hypothetical protein